MTAVAAKLTSTQGSAKSQVIDLNAGPAGEDLCQFVICRIDQEEFAIDVLSVQEINRLVEVTRVPKTPRYVEGVINLRGRIIPVLDLRRRFGLEASTQTLQSRIVVVSIQAKLVGFIVDSVVEVLRVPKSAIEPPPNIGSAAGAEFTQGVGRIDDRLLIVLDLRRLLVKSEAG